eukprot:GHUV01013591.1.p1 GENE.GHUV01013591.1~~GHUV01013591.1.p1  ORF type:complete len:110 (-),score=27.97 GHUV01013591.1:455-784(-)
MPAVNQAYTKPCHGTSSLVRQQGIAQSKGREAAVSSACWMSKHASMCWLSIQQADNTGHTNGSNHCLSCQLKLQLLEIVTGSHNTPWFGHLYLKDIIPHHWAWQHHHYD